MFARIFAPTATFLARMAGKGPGGVKQTTPGKSDVMRQSMMDKILKSPQVAGGGCIGVYLHPKYEGG